MIDNKKYVFIGNREFVLNKMLESNLTITKILVVKNSFLEKVIGRNNIDYKVISSKNEVLETLAEIEYDVLISNGCPYILPVKKMKSAKYINIHPSLLPDLRGKDPVVGAILFNRTSGATCHIMNDEVDDGEIISQIEIPVTPDIDVALLYQLCFFAEGEVFILALKNCFKPTKKQELKEDCIYYSFDPADRRINFKEDNETLISKIRAFSNRSQGCEFFHKTFFYKVFKASIVKNSFIENISKSHVNFSVILKFERDIIFKKDNEIIRFSDVHGDLSKFELRSLINE